MYDAKPISLILDLKARIKEYGLKLAFERVIRRENVFSDSTY